MKSIKLLQKIFAAILALTGFIVGIYAIFEPEKGQEILLYSAPYIFVCMGLVCMHEIDRLRKNEEEEKRKNP